MRNYPGEARDIMVVSPSEAKELRRIVRIARHMVEDEWTREGLDRQLVEHHRCLSNLCDDATAFTALRRADLWAEINEYVVACGGDPAANVYGNTRRQNAVAGIERLAEARDVSGGEG